MYSTRHRADRPSTMGDLAKCWMYQGGHSAALRRKVPTYVHIPFGLCTEEVVYVSYLALIVSNNSYLAVNAPSTNSFHYVASLRRYDTIHFWTATTSGGEWGFSLSSVRRFCAARHYLLVGTAGYF